MAREVFSQMGNLSNNTVAPTQFQALSSVINTFKQKEQYFEQKEARRVGIEEASQVFAQKGTQSRLIKENTIKSDAYDQRLVNLYRSQYKNDLNNKAKELYSSFDSDPEGFTKAFENYKTSYVKELDPSIVPEAELYSSSVFSNYSTSVKVNADKKSKEESFAQTNESLDSFYNMSTNASYDGNRELYLYNKNNYNRLVDEQVKANQISSEKGRQLKGRFSLDNASQKASGNLSRILESDNYEKANKYIKNFNMDSKKYSSLEEQAIKSKLQTVYNRSLNAKKSELAVIESQNKKLIEDTIYTLDNGGDPKNLDDVILRSKGTQNEERLTQSLNKRRVINDFGSLQPLEQAEQLRRFKPSNKVEINLKKKLESVHSETNKLIINDQFTLASKQGVIDDIPPILTNEGVNFSERVKLSTKLESFYGTTPSLLTDNEVPFVKQAFTDSTIEEKKSFLVGLSGATPSIAKKTISKLFKNNPNGYAVAGFKLSEGREDVANKILKGQDAISKKLVQGMEDYDSGALKSLQAELSEVYQDTDTLKSMTDAAHSVYVSNIMDGENTDPSSIVELITNGVGEINGKKFPLPNKDVNEDDFEDWYESLNGEDIESMGGIMGGNIEGFSTQGLLENAKLIHYDTGKYRVQMPDRTYLRNKKDDLFILEYKPMIEKQDKSESFTNDITTDYNRLLSL